MKIKILIGLLAVVMCYSCNPFRKIMKEPVKEQGPEYLMKKLKENEFQFSSLTFKFNAEAEFDKKNNSFEGFVRMKKDSAIWVSISPALGIEMFRILITPDSIKMLNRLNNTYFLGDFSYLNKLLQTDVDFDILQALVVGNDFTFYESESFKARVYNNMYHLSTVNRRKLKKHIKTEADKQIVLIQDIYLNPETYKIKRLSVKMVQKEDRKLEVFYSNFKTISSMLIPANLNFKIQAEKKLIKFRVECSKFRVDEIVNFPFTIPAKYQKSQQ